MDECAIGSGLWMTWDSMENWALVLILADIRPCSDYSITATIPDHVYFRASN